MTGNGLFVLDASVGCKWFLTESGTAEAMQLLQSCAAGEIGIAAPAHFVHEVLAVVRREHGSQKVVPAWECLVEAGLDVVPLTGDVVAGAARQCELLGCTFYDALAPAVAHLLGATLVSADARAHGAHPGVQLIG